MIGLTDRQLAIVMEAAKPLSPEKRGLYLQRVEAMLHYRRPSDDNDVPRLQKGHGVRLELSACVKKKSPDFV